MLPIVESHLDETAGIHSDLYSDVLVFHGYDDGSGGRQIAWVQLDAASYDWNRDGSNDNDVSVDLNFVGSGYPDGNTASLDVFFGFNEWELLILPLGTTGNYADLVHNPPEFDGKTVEDLIFMQENLPPAPVNVATITDFEMIRGTVLAGDVNQLVTSDNSYLHTRSGLGQTNADLRTTELVVSTISSKPSPSMLDVMVESRLSNAGVKATLSLKNWGSGEFDSIGTYDIGTAEANNFFKNIDAVNYVGPNGEIELKIKDAIHVPVSFNAFRYEAFIDQVQITVR